MFKNIKVGDKVLVEIFKDYGDRKSEFQMFEVVKKGRLYFYAIRSGCELKFSIKTGEGRLNKAYISMKTYEEEKERERKCHEIYLYMSCKNNLERLTLEELKEIEKIITIC